MQFYYQKISYTENNKLKLSVVKVFRILFHPFSTYRVVQKKVQGCILCKGSPGKWGGKKNEKFDEGGKKMNFS